MAYLSRSYYTANGVLKDYSVGFSFLSRSHVTVYLNGTLTTAWSWVNDSLIRLTTAPASGVVILVKRSTSPSARLVDYVAPSSLNESDLDTDSLQGFYLAQEAVDQANAGVGDDPVTGAFTAGSKRITNVANPTSAQDAATKNYVDTASTSQVVQATTQATNSASSATSAAASAAAANADKVTVAADKVIVAADKASASTSASTATTKAAEASTSATSAVTAKDLAEKWASEAVDVVVQSGKYSAYHWSAKTQQMLQAATIGTSLAGVSVDTAVNTGTYYTTATTTGLPVASDGYLSSHAYDTNTMYHRWTRHSTQETFVRFRTAGVWGSWTLEESATTRTLAGYTFSASGDRFGTLNRIPYLNTAGGMEVGAYIDLHGDATDTSDFHARIQRQGGTNGALTITQTGTGGFNLVPGTGGLKVDGVLVSTRRKLTADTTFYVRTDGNDANDGSANTAAGAFLTGQGAVNYIQNRIDLNGYRPTIQFAAGTYSGLIAVIGPLLGAALTEPLLIQGDTTTPANVVLTTSISGGDVISALSHASVLVQGFKMTHTGGGTGSLLMASHHGRIVFNSVEFGTATGCYHRFALNFGMIAATGSYTVSGGATSHASTQYDGLQTTPVAITCTVTGTPAFTYFMHVLRGAHVYWAGTVSGSATGTRYLVEHGSILDGTAGNTTKFPGSIAGTVDAPSHYI